MPRAHGSIAPNSTSNVWRRTPRLALATLNQQLQEEFDKKLRPIVAELAEEEHIGIIFEVPHQTIVWVSAGDRRHVEGDRASRGRVEAQARLQARSRVA